MDTPAACSIVTLVAEVEKISKLKLKRMRNSPTTDQNSSPARRSSRALSGESMENRQLRGPLTLTDGKDTTWARYPRVTVGEPSRYAAPRDSSARSDEIMPQEKHELDVYTDGSVKTARGQGPNRQLTTSVAAAAADVAVSLTDAERAQLADRFDGSEAECSNVVARSQGRLAVAGARLTRAARPNNNDAGALAAVLAVAAVNHDHQNVHINVYSDSMLLVQSHAAWQGLRKQRQRLRHPMRAAMLTMDALCRKTRRTVLTSVRHVRAHWQADQISHTRRALNSTSADHTVARVATSERWDAAAVPDLSVSEHHVAVKTGDSHAAGVDKHVGGCVRNFVKAEQRRVHVAAAEDSHSGERSQAELCATKTTATVRAAVRETWAAGEGRLSTRAQQLLVRCVSGTLPTYAMMRRWMDQRPRGGPAAVRRLAASHRDRYGFLRSMLVTDDDTEEPTAGCPLCHSDELDDQLDDQAHWTACTALTTMWTKATTARLEPVVVRATTAGTAATATERATTAAELLAAVCKPDESDHWTERCGLFDRARLREMINHGQPAADG